MPEPEPCQSPAFTHPASAYQASCGNCRFAAICLPLALEPEEVEQLDRIVLRRKPIRKGEHLYHQGDEFRSVYALRAGSLKSYRIADGGEEQLTGFRFPGELIGMDGIARNRHASSARALETSLVCEIPFDQLCSLSQRLPALQRHVFRLMSQEIAADQQLLAMLGKYTAEQRVAALLLNISARNKGRRLSPAYVGLPMSRADLGNYLGLSLETISRVLCRLQRRDVLRVGNKEVNIVDPDLLRMLAHG